jgi:hypothetical protein
MNKYRAPGILGEIQVELSRLREGGSMPLVGYQVKQGAFQIVNVIPQQNKRTTKVEPLTEYMTIRQALAWVAIRTTRLRAAEALRRDRTKR